jgi:hypothetical protein
MLRATVKPLAKAITVGLSHQGGADAFVFHALTYDPDTYEMLGVKTGTGDLTEARTGSSTAYTTDGTNTWVQTIGANEPNWNKARRVENLLTYSNDFSNAIWKLDGGQGSKDGVQAGIGPNGEDAMEFTLHPSSSTAGFYHNTITQSAGDKSVISIWVRAVSGTQTIRLESSGILSPDITVTETWKRLSHAVTSAGASARIFRLANGSSVAGQNIYVCNAQGEDTAGRASTTPSEYVPTTTAAAAKSFASTNGNSVASNVVTEAVGAPLASVPYLLAHPAATNSLTYSLPDAVNWTETGTSVVGANTTGMDGASDSAVILTDDDTGTQEAVYDDTTVPNDSNVNLFRVFVAKDSDQTRFPRFNLQLRNGTLQQIAVQLNTQTGATSTTASTGTVAADVRDTGAGWCGEYRCEDGNLPGWWRCHRIGQ